MRPAGLSRASEWRRYALKLRGPMHRYTGWTRAGKTPGPRLGVSNRVTRTDIGAAAPHDDGGPGADGRSGLKRRRRIVLGGATALAVFAVGGPVASAWVESPAELAADTAAPRPDVLTAPVQYTALTSTVVLSGTFTPSDRVSASPVSVAATAGNPGGGPLVVTGVFTAPGQAVTSGQVLVEYSGRPVYALPGAIPAYRDMLPGESGKDIVQLQRALQSAGFSRGRDALGVFGGGTKSAVGRFYASMGYAAPTTGPATHQAVTAAQAAYDEQSALVRQLRTPSSPPADPTLAAAQLAQAEQTLQADAAALAQAEAVDGPMVPMSEVLFVPRLPAVVQSISATVGDTASKQLITVADGGLQLIGRLDPADSTFVRTGMKARVSSSATGLQASGTVSAVGTVTPAQGAGNGSYVPVSISPDQSWDGSLNGRTVRITISEAATDSSVLAVPEAALSTGADGRTTVIVLDGSGAQSVVQVRPGVSADGLVAVIPVDADLTQGERVVVGQ